MPPKAGSREADNPRGQSHPNPRGQSSPKKPDSPHPPEGFRRSSLAGSSMTTPARSLAAARAGGGGGKDEAGAAIRRPAAAAFSLRSSLASSLARGDRVRGAHTGSDVEVSHTPKRAMASPTTSTSTPKSEEWPSDVKAHMNAILVSRLEQKVQPRYCMARFDSGDTNRTVTTCSSHRPSPCTAPTA